MNSGIYDLCNEPEAAPYECDVCGGEIFRGEEYVNAGGGLVCEGCLFDLTAKQAFELMGYRVREA